MLILSEDSTTLNNGVFSQIDQKSVKVNEISGIIMEIQNEYTTEPIQDDDSDKGEIKE